MTTRRFISTFAAIAIAAAASHAAHPQNASADTAARTTRSAAPAYGWPVKPFHRQHPVRGFFGDPRVAPAPAGGHRTFHFGVDVSCPNGTAVYATIDGTVVLESYRPETVTVTGNDEHLGHQYWHIRPVVRHGQRVIAYRTVLGYVLAPWEHVHFSELRDGRYVNPLRRGAMGPFEDTTRPWLKALRVEQSERVLAGRSVGDSIDIVVEAYDTTPLAITGHWGGKPVTPALLRWRLLGARGTVALGWRTTVDTRVTIPADDRFHSFFATWTRQNKRTRPGRYRFYLAHDLDTSRLADGRYTVEVQAIDIRDNTGVLATNLTIENSHR